MIDNVSDIISVLLNIAYGAVLAPVLTAITTFAVYGLPTRFLPVAAPWKVILPAIIEEALWRDLPKVLIIDGISSLSGKIGVVFVLSVVFTIGHRYARPRAFFELWLFSIFLYISCIYYPGMNYGLHICRNIFSIDSEPIE